MGAGAARVIVAALGLWAGLASLAQAARIVDVRVGAHPDYDRLVIQIEGEFEAFHQPVRSGERFELELNAVLEQPVLILKTYLPRMGRVTIEGVADGALVSVQARQRQVRAFVLRAPPRIVVDFSSPDSDPLPIPDGAVRLVEAIAPPWGALEPEPEPEPVADPGTPPLIQDGEPLSEPVAEPPLSEPVAEVTAEIPVADPLPLAPPPLAPPRPEGPAEHSEGLDSGTLALAVVAVAAVGAFALLALRRARRRAAPEEALPDPVPSDTITPEELGRGGEDRLVALESRLDEEVRSRSRVEERLLSLHEDMKVVRDRLHRMSRQRETDK